MTWICPNKVASIPKERIQVFLLTMMNILKGKQHLQMKRVMYADNDERAIFFAKGVETEKN
jgi:starch synthase